MSPHCAMALAILVFAGLNRFVPTDDELVRAAWFAVGLLASDIYTALKRR
jgi:hypothetical protein